MSQYKVLDVKVVKREVCKTR